MLLACAVLEWQRPPSFGRAVSEPAAVPFRSCGYRSDQRPRRWGIETKADAAERTWSRDRDPAARRADVSAQPARKGAVDAVRARCGTAMHTPAAGRSMGHLRLVALAVCFCGRDGCLRMSAEHASRMSKLRRQQRKREHETSQPAHSMPAAIRSHPASAAATAHPSIAPFSSTDHHAPEPDRKQCVGRREGWRIR